MSIYQLTHTNFAVPTHHSVPKYCIMLSQIETPNLGRTYTTMSESLYGQYNVNQNAFLQKPVKFGDIETQNIQLKSGDDAQTYKSLYPLVLRQGEDNQITLNIFSTSPGPLICKCQSNGSVDAYCGPLCQMSGVNEQSCKLYLKPLYPGQGSTKIRLMDNLTEVAVIEVDFSVEVPMTAPQPPIQMVGTGVGTSMVMAQTAPVAPLPTFTVPQNQITVDVNPLPVQSQIHKSQLFDLQKQNFNQSQTPATYLPGNTVMNPEIMSLTNKYLSSSNIQHAPAPMIPPSVDTTTPYPVVTNVGQEIPVQPQIGLVSDQAQLMPQPVIAQTIPQIDPTPAIQQQNAFQYQNTQPAQTAALGKSQNVLNKSQNMSTDAHIYMRQSVRDLEPSKCREKLIRVLPADCVVLEGESRRIRVRNVHHGRVHVSCQVTKRNISHIDEKLHEDVDFGDGPDGPAFQILSKKHFDLQACQDATCDIQSCEVVVSFEPRVRRPLHFGKLVLRVEPENGNVKLFQVPLLGVRGKPDVDMQLIGTELTVRNSGAAAAFIRLYGRLARAGAPANTLERPGRLQPEKDALVLQPNQQTLIQVTSDGPSAAAIDEEEIIEARAVPETLRQLALGQEGRGPLAELVKFAGVRDDVLRVMAAAVQVTRVTE